MLRVPMSTSVLRRVATPDLVRRIPGRRALRPDVAAEALVSAVFVAAVLAVGGLFILGVVASPAYYLPCAVVMLASTAAVAVSEGDLRLDPRSPVAIRRARLRTAADYRRRLAISAITVALPVGLLWGLVAGAGRGAALALFTLAARGWWRFLRPEGLRV